MFNLSLEEGVVPLEWQEANIISLFKKGSRNKSENYRPVSLTSVICKLLERLIKYYLVDFLVKNNLMNPSQHGFLKARSCLTNMLCFFGRCHEVGRFLLLLLSTGGNVLPVVLVYGDVAMVDCVDHF